MNYQHLAEATRWMRNSLRLDPHSRRGEPISTAFYTRHPQLVATQLIGSLAVYPDGYCVIAETEAYLDSCDPASRASKYSKGRIVERLRGPTGILLVYGMHRVWLVNIVAHPPGKAGAVLLRGCLHPEQGQVEGPGRVARLMGADRSWDGKPVSPGEGPLSIYYGSVPKTLYAAWRVGVAHDLPVPMRYILAHDGYRPKKYKEGDRVEACHDYPVMRPEDMPVRLVPL